MIFEVVEFTSFVLFCQCLLSTFTCIGVLRNGQMADLNNAAVENSEERDFTV